MLQVFHFDSGIEGNKVLFLGSVHGNEVCGSEAIMEHVEAFKSHNSVLGSGSVTFIPFVNQRAYEERARFIDVNLNRIIEKNDSPKCHEEFLAQELLPFLEKATHVVDLHSMTAATLPMVFVDYDEYENMRLAQTTGVNFCVKGWADVFSADEASSDTISYTHRHSGFGVTVECGQHEDTKSLQVARDVIARVLAEYTSLRSERSTVWVKVEQTTIRITTVIFKESEQDSFVKDFKNFDRVQKGEVVADRKGRGPLSAKEDGYVVLPNVSAKVGHEWFYLGIKE